MNDMDLEEIEKFRKLAKVRKINFAKAINVRDRAVSDTDF